MNDEHLEMCSSDGWREMVQNMIMPWAIGGVPLGDHVLEVGPGPGMTTDALRSEVAHLTALELDASLATQLTARCRGTNVDVIRGDATAMPFGNDRFTGAVSFTMLHHVPSVALQDRLFSEVARVLGHGASFIASDSVASAELEAFHHDDVYNPVDPGTVESRFRRAGFASVAVQANEFGWSARAIA